MTIAKKSSLSWANNIDFIKIFSSFWLVSFQPLVEAFRGWRLKVIPTTNCLAVGIFFQVFIIFGWDFYFFKIVNVDSLYPMNLFVRLPYMVMVAMSGFWIWGFFQVVLQKKLIKKLTTAFIDAGLKSASGRLPSFIYDKPIDSETRHLRLKKNGASMEKWAVAEKTLAEDLQIFIDNFHDNRAEGTVDVFYAHSPMTDKYVYEGHAGLKKNEFYVGKARTKVHKMDFTKCPHFLVAGQTDFGKSHFLNQAITSLYLNNKSYTFELIDLKFGAEFDLHFSNLPRAKVYDSATAAAKTLSKIAEKTIKNRARFLKDNKCQNIGDLENVSQEDLVIKENSPIKKRFGRMVIAIDEAYELFLKNSKADAQSASLARQSVIKIAAQGRSVGVHLMLGTQRPDRKAIDPMIKANLPGKICFPVPNNATSITILDSARGAQLPRTKGRCIWKVGGEMVELQAPFLPKEEIEKLLKPFKTEPEVKEEDKKVAVEPEEVPALEVDEESEDVI